MGVGTDTNIASCSLPVNSIPLYVAPNGQSTSCLTIDSPCGTISAALAVASSNDEIFLQPGNYTGVGNRNLLLSDGRVLVITGSGQGVSVIDLESMGTRLDLGLQLVAVHFSCLAYF